MLRTKNLPIFLVCILLYAWFTSSGIWKRVKANASIHFRKKETVITHSIFEKLKKKSDEAIEFAKNNIHLIRAQKVNQW